MCNTRKSAHCASLGMLVSLVADSYEKQTIASHKGSKIKAWKEKAVEQEKRKREREREEREGRRKKAPFNALGSTVFSPTFHPALFLLASHFLIIPEVYETARYTIAREFARPIGHRSGRSKSDETLRYMIKIDWRYIPTPSMLGRRGRIFVRPLNPSNNAARGRPSSIFPSLDDNAALGRNRGRREWECRVIGVR